MEIINFLRDNKSMQFRMMHSVHCIYTCTSNDCNAVDNNEHKPNLPSIDRIRMEHGTSKHLLQRQTQKEINKPKNKKKVSPFQANACDFISVLMPFCLSMLGVGSDGVESGGKLWTLYHIKNLVRRLYRARTHAYVSV